MIIVYLIGKAMTNKTKSAIEEAADEHKKQFNSLVRGLIEEDDRAYECFIKGAEHVIEHPERYGLTARKPIGAQEVLELVRQMLAEEISFSRFVELINERGTK